MIKLVLSRPITFMMLFLGIVIVGFVALSKLPVELMPNYSFNQISIILTVRGGIPADQVEYLVTKPVEEAVSTVSHLKRVTSISKESESTTILDFEPETDMDFAALEIREKFARVREKLPREVEKPIIAQFQQGDIPIMILAMTGEKYSPEQLRRIVDEEVLDKLKRVSGIASVDVVGGRERKILIDVDQNKLNSYNLPIGHVVSMVNLSNFSVLAGKLSYKQDQYRIRAIGEFENLEEISNLGVAKTEDGSMIRLKDVADIEDSFLDPVGFSRVDIKPVVSLYLQKESDANTLEVVNNVKQTLQTIREKLAPHSIFVVTTKDDAEFIKKAMGSVKQSLFIGTFLAISVLFLFLRDTRIISVIAITVPLCVLITISLMYFQNISLNIMTLSGIALGIGMLLDNSIVVIDNVVKKSSRKDSLSLEQDIQHGTGEVVLAIFASTLTTIVVFLPLTFISQEVRRLYGGVALTITFSLLASLFISQTFVPLAMSRFKCRPAVTAKQQHGNLHQWEPAWLVRLTRQYKLRLLSFLRTGYKGLVPVFGIFILAVFVFSGLGAEFLEPAQIGKFTVHVQLPTGTKLEATDATVAEVEKILASVPEVKTISTKAERWSTKIYVTLVPRKHRKHSREQIIADLRPKLQEIQPAFIYFEESQEIGSEEIFVELYGCDYDLLKNLAVQSARAISGVNSFTDTKIRMEEGRPVMCITLDKAKMGLFGLTAGSVAKELHTQMRGLVATRYRAEAKEVETIVRLAPEFRNTLDSLHNLNTVNPWGQPVYLAQIAKFSMSKDPSEIWHRNKERMAQVSTNRGRIPLNKAAELIRSKMQSLKFPEGYSWEFGYNYFSMIRNRQEFTQVGVLVLILIYLVLASLFESYFQPLIIMTSVPLALIGASFALKLTGNSVSMGVWVGLVVLGGIVVNNAIILVDRVNFFRREVTKSENSTKFVLVRCLTRACQDRLRPILMTTLTTILGLVPLAVDRSESSALWSVLAITVVGGLSVSAFLTLFVVPSVYMVFENLKQRIVAI